MNPTRLRKALASMTHSLAEKGDYLSIFQALKSASPEVAAKYLEACSADEALAGATLAMAINDSDGYASIDHCLTGNASKVLKMTKYLAPRFDQVNAYVRAVKGSQL